MSSEPKNRIPNFYNKPGLENFRIFIIVGIITELIFSFYQFIKFYFFWIQGAIIEYHLIVFQYILYAFLLIIFSCLILYFYRFIRRLKESRRWDIFVTGTSTIAFVIYFNNARSFDFSSLINSLLIFFCYLIIIKSSIDENNNFFYGESFLVSDLPEEDIDKLDIKKDAEVFAKIVLNNFSKESLVFGLDAPWGSGKTTFINFCKKYWDSPEYKNKVFVFKFEPLNFIGDDNIFDKFIQELSKAINNAYLIPNFKRALNRYAQILKNISFNGAWFNFSFKDDSKTSENALDELKDTINNFAGKIVIVIDDLDRLPINDIKTIVDVVKKSFVLPNVSYILCYETKNIDVFDTQLKNSHTEATVWKRENKKSELAYTAKLVSNENIDYRKIVEYLEKVINIKQTLITKRERIKDYFLEILKKTSASNESVDSGYEGQFLSEESVREAEIAIERIFNPSEFEKYSCFIGDIRKIKRFINILKMKISSLDLVKTDINFYDLFNLMLIYINFPNIFRKIYVTETDGARGFFSLSYNYGRISNESDKRRYINSTYYKKYVESLQPDEKFLLNQIFCEDNFKDVGDEGSKIIANSAAFNGGETGAGNNLENYLDLIIENKSPIVAKEFNFHYRNINKIIASEVTIEAVFHMEQYDLSKYGEQIMSIFFRTLFANMKLLDYVSAQKVIDYILDNVKSFSVVEITDSNIGLRHMFSSGLVALLNDKGFNKTGNAFDNSEENIKLIADRVFGEGEFKDKGIIEKLSKDRGVLGIYDLLMFRLYCCQDRSGGYFNLYSAISQHANPDAKMGGLVVDLLKDEMREISQMCFKIFEKIYITPKVDIFKDIDDLTDKNMFGNTLEYLEGEAKDKNISLFNEKEMSKSQIKSFILYQIGNNIISSGIGCGYYNESGGESAENKNGIKKAISKYLFEVCFDISDKNKKIHNAENFIDYLLISMGRGMRMREGLVYQPSKEEYLVVLDEDMLKKYWSENGETIKSILREDDNKIIRTKSYVASYSEHIETLFSFLDKEFK